MQQKETFLRKRNKKLRVCFVGKLESYQHFFYYHLLRNREAGKTKGTGVEWVSKNLPTGEASRIKRLPRTVRLRGEQKNVKIGYPHSNPFYKLSHDESIEKELSLYPLTHK